LNTKTIGDADATAIQQNSNPVHLTAGNKGLLEDIVTINKASMRDGKAIPDTNAFTTTTITDNGYGDGAAIMVPNKGEVLSLQAIGITANTSPSSSVTFYLFMQDQTLDNSSSSQAIYMDSVSSGSSNTPFTGGSTPSWWGLEVAYPMQLWLYVNAMNGVTTFTPKVAHYRVR
jgi:hypothetical protein